MALIAHYPLNGDLLDHSGNGYDIVSGSGTYVSGKTGRAISTTELLNTNLDFTDDLNYQNASYSFCGWFKFDETLVKNKILSALASSQYEEPTGNLLGHNSYGGVSLTWSSDSEAKTPNIFLYCRSPEGSKGTSNTPMVFDEWVHYTCVINRSSNKLSFYLNGNLVGSLVDYNTSSIPPSGRVFGINRGVIYDGNGPSFPIPLEVCDVRVYDHALSQKEILELSKAKVLHYKFNEFKEPTENKYNLDVSYNTWPSSSSNMTTLGTKTGRHSFKVEGVCNVPGAYLYIYPYFNTNAALTTLSAKVKNNNTKELRVDVTMREYGNKSDIVNNTKSFYIQPYRTEYIYLTSEGITTNSGYTPAFGVYSDSTDGTVNAEVYDIQLEEKDHATPYTPNTREAKIIDLSGLGNHTELSLNNSPTWTEDSPIGGGSYEFNGTSSNYLTLPHSTINLPSLKNCSISFWRKKTSSGNWLLLQGGTSGGDNYIMATASGTGDFYHNNVGNNWEIFVDAIPRPNPIDDTEWHHYVIRDVNLSSWTQLLLNNYASWYFRGILSDLRIYNSVLSDKDIKELYKNRMNIDDEGNVSIHNMSETGHVPLIMDYTTWEEGQVGSIGKFSVYTNSAGNRRVKTDDPWGKQSVVWQGETTESNIAGSGIYFSSSTPIDKTKLYRFSWWERRVSNSTTTAGSYYAGLNGYPDGVLPLDSNTPTTNPYFYSVSYSGLPIGQWFLVVGHVYPYTKEVVAKTVEHKDSGRWKVDGTKLGSISGDFRWMSNTTTGRSGSIMIYQPNAAGMIHQTAFPRMDICDGTEPSLSELLAGFDRNYIEKIKKDGGASKAIIEISKTNNYSREISEVGPVDGLVAWYPLNYDTLDYSGNGNHGINNGATPVAGLNGGAYYFNNSSYIRLPQEFSVDSYTISMWFKRDSFEGDSYGNLIGTQTDERSNDKGFQIPTKQSSTQSGRCYLYNSSVISKTFEAGEWFFVSITKTPEITKMFWNGEFHNSEATQTRSLFTKLDIGQWNGSERYLGFIQDVRIYDRALTEEEIKILYELRKNKNTLFTERGEIYLPGELDETY